MKPRRLIEAEESAGTELALALERIAVLEAWKDRAAVVAYSVDGRLAAIEDRLCMGAQPEIVGYTVAAFAKRVCRSKELIRKYIRQGRIPVLPRLGARVIIEGDAVLPPRRRRRGSGPA